MAKRKPDKQKVAEGQKRFESAREQASERATARSQAPRRSRAENAAEGRLRLQAVAPAPEEAPTGPTPPAPQAFAPPGAPPQAQMALDTATSDAFISLASSRAQNAEEAPRGLPPQGQEAFTFQDAQGRQRKPGRLAAKLLQRQQVNDISKIADVFDRAGKNTGFARVPTEAGVIGLEHLPPQFVEGAGLAEGGPRSYSLQQLQDVGKKQNLNSRQFRMMQQILQNGRQQFNERQRTARRAGPEPAAAAGEPVR